jgi:hypothetical protein
VLDNAADTAERAAVGVDISEVQAGNLLEIREWGR